MSRTLPLNRYCTPAVYRSTNGIPTIATMSITVRVSFAADALETVMLKAGFVEDFRMFGYRPAEIVARERNNTAALEKTVLSSFKEYPEAYTSLIVDRNRAWIPQLEKCLSRPMPCFVVVGAAHMVGPDGVLNLLKVKGYKIEQQ